ncbi:MAG TPA: hypothetical protein VGS78_06570 [Candidatus Sulfotelmatobacter sp.]|nr:hypothetical protein [Candidatus Sulfotelmatobacter sp.]
MKNWRVFVFGFAGFLLLALLPIYMHLIAAAAAVLIVAAVILGFIWRPENEIFYVQTLSFVRRPGHGKMTRDRIAVKVELIRLSLLFLPTVLAVGLLLLIYAKGASWWIVFWNVKPIQVFIANGAYFALMLLEAILIGVFWLLSAWLSERWVLRDAQVCTARSISKNRRRIMYGFQDKDGGYYGGVGFPCSQRCSAQLAALVFYRAASPQQNKLAMCCLFHRFIIVGRGIKDPDEVAIAAYSAEPSPQNP